MTPDPIQLALALGSVRSVVRVIDRTVPPLVVDWATISEETDTVRSITDFANHAIHVNPTPLLDGRVDQETAKTICVGFGVHEAGHSRSSRESHATLIGKKPMKYPAYPDDVNREGPAFEPMRVAAYLWNVAEDVRSEGITTDDWPGFQRYLDAVLAYMWDELRLKHELPTEYGPDLAGKLRVMFLACRYPDKSLDPALAPEIAWWQNWQHEYLSGAATVAETIQRGLDHLAEEFSTHEELVNMAALEQAQRDAGEAIRQQIERLIKEGVSGTFEVCIADNGEIIPLDKETAEKVNQLVREGLIEHKTIITAKGAVTAPVRVRKPEETFRSKVAYVGRPNAQSEAIRAALVFRNSALQHDLKLQKTGEIDDEELYRWGMGDPRVFSQRVIEAKPDVLMGLLVDMSGSMRGEKLDIAQRLAQLLVWAVHDQEGVETQVWGHTADIDQSRPSSDVFRLWETGDPISRLGLISTLPHSNNRDGQAIEAVVKAMADREQPEKVLLVLADGQPSGRGYGGEPAAAHVRSVVRWAESRGVRVIQIAIDPEELLIEEQVAMFGPNGVVPYIDDASLPRQLGQIMGRYL